MFYMVALQHITWKAACMVVLSCTLHHNNNSLRVRQPPLLLHFMPFHAVHTNVQPAL